MQTLTVIKDTVFKKASTSQNPAERFFLSAGSTLNVKYAYRVGQHCFVELADPLGNIGRLGYFFREHVKVKLDEVRGVWLTNVDSDVLHSKANIKAALNKLKALGYNTLYPVVWNRGYTLYPSAIAAPVTGASVMPNSAFEGRDMLAELIELARPMGFRIIPWFEYGLILPAEPIIGLPTSQISTNHPDWLTVNSSGQRRNGEFLWLTPSHRGVQNFMTSLIGELVEKYDVDGIQLDDHFGFPREMGYDAVTQSRFRAVTGKTAPSNHADPAWGNFARSEVTNLLNQIFNAVKAKRPNCIISISPNPLGFSRDRFMADWNAWDDLGLMEECVIQVYRNDLSDFSKELNDKPELTKVSTHIPTSIGIMAGLKPEPVKTGVIRSQLEAVRRKELAGASFFFYETVVFSDLKQRTPRSQDELQSLFPVQQMVAMS
jgi:uncharacterized lipoprotein YddW (UPF0748 family)